MRQLFEMDLQDYNEGDKVFSRRILITGGTVFVTKTIAEYYVAKGHEVYVLNRNTKEQPAGVILIESDRYDLKDKLKKYEFDLVIDNAYTSEEVELLLTALGKFRDYILISSSAVYPEYEKQPFTENGKLGENKFWGKYGTDKMEAERVLLEKVPTAYILRPPYLYGPMNNVYRESFAFDCAMANRKFYLPKDGSMKLQFLLVDDMCRFIDVLLENRPKQRIFNVGNKTSVTVKEWVTLCYETAGKQPWFVNVEKEIEQRNYFSFYDYEYYLDVTEQYKLMPEITDLREGLRKAFIWYQENSDKVNRKKYTEFIDSNL